MFDSITYEQLAKKIMQMSPKQRSCNAVFQHLNEVFDVVVIDIATKTDCDELERSGGQIIQPNSPIMKDYDADIIDNNCPYFKTFCLKVMGGCAGSSCKKWEELYV